MGYIVFKFLILVVLIEAAESFNRVLAVTLCVASLSQNQICCDRSTARS